MTFLPIVDRELRVQARQRSTFRFRVGAALVAIVAVGILLVVADLSSTNPNGDSLFGVLAGLVFLYCAFEGARNTADCLSEEKRAGTLGLLLLTDLRGYDIVLGKLIATSLNSLYTLLAVLPPLAIPLVLGGVTAGEFWRMVLVLLAALFCAVTGGLFASAISRHEGKAWLGTLVLTGILCVGPGLAFWCAFAANYQAGAQTFWMALLSALALGCGLLAAANGVLPRTWQEVAVQGRAPWLRWLESKWPRRWQARYKLARARLRQHNPALWLASRAQEQAWLVWAAVGLVCVGAGVVGIVVRGPEAPTWGKVISVAALHLIFAGWVAWQACQSFANARRSGMLELLLSTPEPVARLVEGHFRGLRRLFLGPVVCLFFVGIPLLFADEIADAVWRSSVTGVLIVGLGVSILLLFALLDFYAVAWFGLWMGLRLPKVGSALTRTILFVLVLPLVGGVLCSPTWPVIWLLKNLIFMSYAREQLRRHFRAVVAGEFPPGSEPAARRSVPAKPGQLPNVLDG
jgi:hypothetical protein